MESRQEAVAVDRSTVLTQALVETARRLEIGPTEIGRILGVSQPTASRLLKGDYVLKEAAKEWELSAHLVRLYRSLFSLVGGDDSLARGWLNSVNQAFAGQKPVALIKRVDGLLHVCEYLDAHRARI
ncbi:MbcA/ParS/Xre antitoxin family protein [Rhodocyclus tenuis]|uniref:MbcA/ParS/Xre antitoxin family protein n=1 Tax=Rhodocyclus tenuis TaxID=1066 RepID=UPI0019037F16|nr:MbcA/ParS/Xre antitoxin family protein [Rhodocyclus tenuis]MBK1681445.1 hypothetical protein [Rhodocyclus tenuis]